MRYSTGYPVTPHDVNPSVRANDVTDGLYVGGAGTGTLRVTMSDDKLLNLVGVTVGYHPLAVKMVWSTGTGVTDVVALKY